MSLEQLLQIQVTTASRKPELRTSAASAISVLTNERIRRSGATTYADLLRIVPGIHVIRSDASTWGVTARGLNLNTANKLQVLQDGRILYTPLFSGVFWNVQDYPFYDIDQIEVIRGPGAALWGGNAVNGVVNIITLSAKETQGAIVEAGAGDVENGFFSGRYGGKIGDSTYYRAYMKYFNRDGLVLANGQDTQNAWAMGKGGFRVDGGTMQTDAYTVQGDIYSNTQDFPDRNDGDSHGGNLLGRWTHGFSASSNLQVQAYYDRSDRKIPGQFQEKRDTYDLDLQHRFQMARRNDVVWGFNYRASADQTYDIGTIQFVPDSRTIYHFSGFFQDEIALKPQNLSLILGTKLEDNTFSNVELEPNVRLSWVLKDEHTVWGAVSRAVRVPSRIDTDFRFFPLPNFLAIEGNPDFQPEELFAVEGGYRFYPHKKFNLDVSAFYHNYDSLITLEPGGPGQPAIVGNGMNATTSGTTIGALFDAYSWIRFMGSLSLLHKTLKLDPASHDISNAIGEGDDPNHYWFFQAQVDPGKNFQLDAILRASGELPSPLVPGYVTMDFRIAWLATKQIELSFVGQNLFQDSHPEFGNPSPARQEVQRSFYGKITWHF